MAQAAVTRFAPSPTGRLHVGHAFAALFAAEAAHATANGRFLLRIEDIDKGRCRPAFESAIFEDLGWLGLRWEEPVRRQSAHMADYAAALSTLDAAGLLYPCFCTRAEIKAEIAAAGHAPHGPEGPRYPGTCRRLDEAERTARKAEEGAFALRLDMTRATSKAGPLTWRDQDHGEQAARPEQFGDVVLARKDVPTSYHLAVTVDDHLQGITLVTRGDDLREATHLHRLLQALLGYEAPHYRHHPLILNRDGKRFAKREQSATLAALREAGTTPDQLRGAIASGDSERLLALVEAAESALHADHRP